MSTSRSSSSAGGALRSYVVQAALPCRRNRKPSLARDRPEGRRGGTVHGHRLVVVEGARRPLDARRVHLAPEAALPRPGHRVQELDRALEAHTSVTNWVISTVAGPCGVSHQLIDAGPRAEVRRRLDEPDRGGHLGRRVPTTASRFSWISCRSSSTFSSLSCPSPSRRVLEDDRVARQRPQLGVLAELPEGPQRRRDHHQAAGPHPAACRDLAQLRAGPTCSPASGSASGRTRAPVLRNSSYQLVASSR